MARKSKAMSWVVYRDLYLERLETRHPGSEHPNQVRRVLLRFTKTGGLSGRSLPSITPRLTWNNMFASVEKTGTETVR